MVRRPTVEQAATMVAQGLTRVASEQVPLSEALGRFLSFAIPAGQDLPPFPLAAVNGYALRSSDLTRARSGRPVPLKVVDALTPGQEAAIPVNPGQAVRVAAGGMLPAGCDGVVCLEDTDGGSQTVTVRRELWPFENFVRQGSDCRADELLLPAGQRLTASAIALLSALGLSQVPVCRAPRAAILSIGDALVQPGLPHKGGQLCASAPYFLRARLSELGAQVPFFLFTPSRPEHLAQVLADCLTKSDLILTVGGLTAGEGQCVAKALAILSAEPVFFQVQLEQGECVLFARAGEKGILSLPASPCAAALLFELFIPTALSALTGCRELLPAWQTVTLDVSFPKASPNRRFLWAALAGGHIEALPAQPYSFPPQGANALLEVPAGSPALAPGQRLRALVLS